jgi:NADH-quinone oxidoreductase subunit M
MILLWIVLLPFVGGIFALLAGNRNPSAARWAMTGALAIDTMLLLWLWGRHSGAVEATGAPIWIVRWDVAWIPEPINARFMFAMDGLSLLMSILSCIVGLVAVSLTWFSPRDHAGTHGFLMMSVITAILGVFLSADLLMFFVAFEFMLVPSYALIAFWGNGDRSRAAMRFFIFTQAGGFLMLIAILALYFLHQQVTGVGSFAYTSLLSLSLGPTAGMLIMLGFFAAFAVKLPVVPFHTWQPEAYAAAPNETSILLSALMAKTAGYGILRFVVPLFPDAAERFAPWAMTLGLITILYASWLAYAQTDFKRLIAYSSAGHLGYVLLGAFAQNELALRGAILLMFSHGISVAGLFLISDVVEKQTGQRSIGSVGGLWHTAPRLGGIAMVFIMATLGLPGLGNFVGEFLILIGVFNTHPVVAAIAALGAVLSAAYALRVMQRVFFGPSDEAPTRHDAPVLITAISAVLIAILVWLGIYPQPILDAARVADVTHSATLASTTVNHTAEISGDRR